MLADSMHQPVSADHTHNRSHPQVTRLRGGDRESPPLAVPPALASTWVHRIAEADAYGRDRRCMIMHVELAVGRLLPRQGEGRSDLRNVG
jgi:hypothetical protein